MDSGATSHMANDKKFFDTLEQRDMHDVILANGEGAKVLGIGSGELHCVNENNEQIKIKTTDVLYVPELTENLQ